MGSGTGWDWVRIGVGIGLRLVSFMRSKGGGDGIVSFKKMEGLGWGWIGERDSGEGNESGLIRLSW